jgi:hypothetical protein
MLENQAGVQIFTFFGRNPWDLIHGTREERLPQRIAGIDDLQTAKEPAHAVTNKHHLFECAGFVAWIP